MENIFSQKFSWKSFYVLLILSVLPNLFGMLNIPTIWGFKIHFFQYFLFLAAAIYGPFAGLVAGGVGSAYSAVSLGNPYIIIGNMILGFFVGYFLRKDFGVLRSVLLAFAIQLPWLYLTDVYFVGIPVSVVYKLIIALFISDMVWAGFTKISLKRIKNLLE